MTQQEFMKSLEVALSWMHSVQERLKANDNTQGPRDALEVRLRETEKIYQSQYEGQAKVENAVAAAETLLQSGDVELKNQTQARLKDLKSLWEETCTYIIHCHSRIEWVWLHWNEYLKAYEEYEEWLSRQQRSLDVRLELQLGVKEKLWQVDQQRVVVSDIHSQATLLERLLDEAAALHNRTQDPTVDPQAQERLRDVYNNVRDRAEERLSLLHKIGEEHQIYKDYAQKFMSWLPTKTKELTDLKEREDTTENKLKALQALESGVAGEEKTLQHIESLAEAMRANTSPAGGESVMKESEELRHEWQRLKKDLDVTEEGLRCSLDSHSQYVARCQRLRDDISHLRVLMKRLDQELEESCEAGNRTDHTEEQMVGQWKKYTGVRNTLEGEESQIELFKAQLKELFRFSEDSRHLSDDVLAIVKEHQSVKCRASRLCSESELGLRNILQDPLLVYAQWSHMVSQALEASADLTDFSHIAMLVQKIEHLLKDSVQLQERFTLLQVKGDLLDSVFSPERSNSLQDELNAAIRNRELLHTQLLQRKSRLQGLISSTKDFMEAYQLIVSRLAAFRDRLVAADGPRPDILAKKSQSDQLWLIQKDLEDAEAHITALETLVSSSQSNRTQCKRLHADWKQLLTAVREKVHENKQSLLDHESFHDSMLNMEKWLMIIKQKLESFHSPSGDWSIESRHQEAEALLGEFPEKELCLQQMEVQAQRVLKRTSVEGQVHIVRDLKRLQESWLALYNMSLNLHRLLNKSPKKIESELSMCKPSITKETSQEDGNSQANAELSRIQSGSQDQSTLASSQPQRRGKLKEEVGKPIITGQGKWFPGNSKGHLILTRHDKEHLIPWRRGTDGEHSITGNEVDFLAWDIRSRAAQKVPKDSHSVQPSNKNSVTGDKREIVYSTMLSCEEGSMETGEGLSTGGGAFMLFRRDAAKKLATSTHHTRGGRGQCVSRREQFETWLSKENDRLSGILCTSRDILSAKDLKIRQNTLKVLRAGVAWGQEQFQLLLQESQGSETADGLAEDVCLEELRYRWMLYKSKLKDVRDIRARTNTKRIQVKQEELAMAAEVQKKPSLLHRVCRLALPLWLFLLTLLLLAFLLPLMDEGNSCSFSNNFARSFKIMLRYDGPPPT